MKKIVPEIIRTVNSVVVLMAVFYFAIYFFRSLVGINYSMGLGEALATHAAALLVLALFGWFHLTRLRRC